MTDNFGSGPQDRNENMSSETALEDTEDSSLEAPAEAPSEYEFSDGLPPEEQIVVPAKRSALLPVAVALGGIALLGGAAWWHLNGDSLPGVESPKPSFAEKVPQPQTTLPEATQVSSVPPLSPEPAPSFAPAVEPSGAAPTTSSIPAPPPLPANPQEPAPAAPVVVAANVGSRAVQAVPLPPPVSSQAIAPQTTGSGTQVKSDTDTRIEALSARVEDLQKALDQANERLSHFSAIDGAPVSAESLDQRIAKLEKRLGRKAAPSKAADDLAFDEVAAPAPVKKVVKPSAPKTRKVVAKAEPTPSWVLRAASTGEGWISQSADSKELKKVHVGDMVAGVGKVTAIEPQGDSWIVRGTKGSVQ